MFYVLVAKVNSVELDSDSWVALVVCVLFWCVMGAWSAEFNFFAAVQQLEYHFGANRLVS